MEDEFCSCWCKGTSSPMPISQVKSSCIAIFIRLMNQNSRCPDNRNHNNNNNNICLKSNIQTSSVDYAPRELTHACSRSETCSRSDTEACDMCYVF